MPLITIEGLDGSGKSTIVEMLKEHLLSQGKDCLYLHFPSTSGAYRPFILRYLHGDLGSLKRINPYLPAALFAADRARSKDTILKYLKKGYWVILDRYVFSNIAYQCARFRKEADKFRLYRDIFTLEYYYNDMPEANVSLFLDVPLKFVKHNLRMRQGNDIHEASMKYQRAVRKEYLKLVKQGELIRIDCTDENGEICSPNTILDGVLAAIATKY